MSVVNGKSLLAAAPIENMIDHKAAAHGLSHGLDESGYSIRTAEAMTFQPPDAMGYWLAMRKLDKMDRTSYHEFKRAYEDADRRFHGYTIVNGMVKVGRSCLASSLERFTMPTHLVADMRSKSTHARQFICAWPGTTAEPGWGGNLTIEVTFLGSERIEIPAGTAIAQVLFHELAEPADYADGKYQEQPARPVEAIMSGLKP